ncbi:MAG TPA: hypothetical protein DD396_06610 [Bacteroidetes bacterium]|jgi:hypothetical protein|nr:hypothetical protein [Bacteroidota bacterium]HCD67759.1 hypothetical protein [Bacteroidota bacterium]
MKSKYIIFGIMAISAISCQKEYETELLNGSDLAGEWYVETGIDGEVFASLGHQLISTYNTAAEDGSIWLDDHGHIWPMKGKISAAPGATSFSGTFENLEAPMYSYDTLDVIRDESIDPIDSVTQNLEGYYTINVKEGKVISGAGHSKTGVMVDSIYIRAEFGDDPGTDYEFAGHRRTGFLEDDY